MKSGSGAIFDNGTQEPFSPLSLSKKSTIANHATQQELHVHQREMRREVVQVLNIILLDIDFAAGEKKQSREVWSCKKEECNIGEQLPAKTFILP